MASEEKTYEMVWDCEYCGAKKLLGLTHRHCPECGAAQNPQHRYFPPDNEKVAVQDHQYVGADLHCPSCREPQSARVKHCTNCGGPIAGGAAAARQADHVVGPGGAVQGQPMQGQAIQAAPAGATPPAPKSKRWIGIVIGVVALAIVSFIVLLLVWKKETGVEVASHSWTREIPVERYEAVKEKGACSGVPSGAKILDRSKAEPVCKTRKVDQGDGTFKEKKECSEPVEQCTYEVMKWKVSRTLKETGKGLDSKPKWPEVRLGRTGNCDGCEREGTRKETYTVHFKEAKTNEELTCDYDSAEAWAKHSVGTSYKAKKHVIGGALDCSSLRR